MSVHVILGKGPVGSAVAERLLDEGQTVRVLSRSGGSTASQLGAEPSPVEHVAVDAADADALARAARGADMIYNCANPPYHRWAEQWPPMASALLAAAERTGAVLVTMGNLYPYDPVDVSMTEDLPLVAPGTKGQVRARMWRDMLAAHEAGRVRTTEARASDFVGPGVVDGGHLAGRVVPRVLAGKGVRMIGAIDQPHSWTAIGDIAATLVALGSDERAWGRPWHVPTAPPVTQEQAVHALCRAAGVATVPVRTMPHLMIRTAGLVVPFMRELEETRYQFTRPYVLDASAATATFGLEATPLEQTWSDTVAWWRTRLGTGAPPAAV